MYPYRDELIIYKQEHGGMFQLVAKQTPGDCLDASLSRKRNALETVRATSSRCKWHASQVN